MKYSIIVAVSMAAAAAARPGFISSKRAAFDQKNGQDAIALNNKFKTLTANSPCQAGEQACVTDQFAQCVGGKFVLQPCGPGTICAALPLVNSAGTSITCTTAADRDARIAATGATAAAPPPPPAPPASSAPPAPAPSASAPPPPPAAGNNAGNGAAAGGDDPQTSLTLSKDALQDYSSNGNADASAGQEPSITSTNNFINFCLTVPGKTKTSGKQVIEGSCNQTPMGVIAAQAQMPFAKFTSPANLAKIPANKDFTISVNVQNMELGHFTNPATTFHMAPQQVNAAGLIKGHSHVTVQRLQAIDQVAPVAATDFVFFKGLNDAGKNGVLSVTVPGGLPAGIYRAATINSAANHQPALVAVAQRGSLDDMVYFTVA